MSLQDLKTSTQALTAEEWAEFLGWCVSEERPRREMLQAQEEARTRLILHLRELGEIPAPDALREPPRHVEDAPEWQHPKDEPQNCYIQGDIIQHEGKLYKSVYPHLNCSTPGADSKWAQIEPAPEPSEPATPPEESQ